MKRNILWSLAPVAAMVCGFALAAGSDELWEFSTKMEMPGMAMPAMKSTQCLPKDSPYRPDDENAKPDKNCTVLDYNTSGNTSRWKMRCTGKDPMEGSGEMTRTADSMKGITKISAPGMQMTQVMTGKRIGTCDAKAERNKMEAAAVANREKVCKAQVEDAIKNGGYTPKMPNTFIDQRACASSKNLVCQGARPYAATFEGYAAYTRSKGWVAAECGINMEANRVALCQRALSDRSYGFIRQTCPAETATLKAQYDKSCQGFGRGYTSDHAHPNAALCRSLQSFGRGGSPSGAQSTPGNSQGVVPPPSRQAPPPPSRQSPPSGADNMRDGAKALKGMFGF